MSFSSPLYPRRRVRQDVGTDSMTEQHHKDACDIHNILRQYQRTGVISHITAQQARFEDLPSNVDLQDSIHVQRQAEEAFMALPAVVRREFDNDPGQLLAALDDPAKADRLRELGILKPLPPETGPEPRQQGGAPGAPSPAAE